MSGLPEALVSLLSRWRLTEKRFADSIPSGDDGCFAPETHQHHYDMGQSDTAGNCADELEARWPAIRAELLAESAAREKRLRAALEDSRAALMSLPVYLSDGQADVLRWPIRDELAGKINRALADTQPEETP